MNCGCGSGLTERRCCAIIPDAFAAVADAPLLPVLREAETTHDPARAVALCREVLELSPYHQPSLMLLARHLRTTGNPAAAACLLRRLLTRDPNHLDATQTLAALLLDLGARESAEVQARNTIRLAPRSAQSHYLLGLAVTEAGAPRTGEAQYRRALTYAASRDPALLANLAWSLKLQGRFDEARALYREATTAAPTLMPAWLGWARLEEADRAYAAAAAHLDRAERLAPEAPAPRLLRAVLQDRTGAPQTALATIDALPEAALGVEERLQRGACWTGSAATTKPSPPSPPARLCCARPPAKPTTPPPPPRSRPISRRSSPAPASPSCPVRRPLRAPPPPFSSSAFPAAAPRSPNRCCPPTAASPPAVNCR